MEEDSGWRRTRDGGGFFSSSSSSGQRLTPHPSPPQATYGKDGLLSLWLFFQPMVYCINNDLTREMLGYPGADPSVANACTTHLDNGITSTFGNFFTKPVSDPDWKLLRKYVHQHLLGSHILRKGLDGLCEEVRLW